MKTSIACVIIGFVFGLICHKSFVVFKDEYDKEVMFQQLKEHAAEGALELQKEVCKLQLEHRNNPIRIDIKDWMQEWMDKFFEPKF